MYVYLLISWQTVASNFSLCPLSKLIPHLKVTFTGVHSETMSGPLITHVVAPYLFNGVSHNTISLSCSNANLNEGGGWYKVLGDDGRVILRGKLDMKGMKIICIHLFPFYVINIHISPSPFKYEQSIFHPAIATWLGEGGADCKAIEIQCVCVCDWSWLLSSALLAFVAIEWQNPHPTFL